MHVKKEDKTVQIVKMGAWSGGPGCHGGCGVEVYIKDGRVIKVEGDPDHPFLQGRTCPRVLATTQLMYHPDRLKYPQKRIGQRGEGKWARISWEEAYDTIFARMTEIKEKYGPEAMVFGQGTGRDAGGPILLLAYAYGSPNWTLLGLSGISCFTPRLAAMYVTEGDFTFMDAAQFSPLRYQDPEWTPPKCLIVWGREPVGGCSDHYATGHWMIDCMKRGTKIIAVDPRCTWIASRADLWLQIRPATDGALALGMLNIIINEGLYDKPFVEKWVHGFEELKRRVQEYPPDRVSYITWIPKEKIVEAARLYARSKPAAIQWGVPVDMNAEATSVIQAITSLWCVTGNLDIPGGNVICRGPFGVSIYPYSSEELTAIYGKAFVQKLSEKRIGADRYPLVKNFRGWALSDIVLEQMETGDPYPIKGMWIQTNNFLACAAGEPRRHYEAIRKLDFNVVVDLFMTPTAQAVADIVLPAGTFPEKDSVFSTGIPLNAIQKVVEVEECKSDWEINFELAKRFNPEIVHWKNVREMFTERISPSGLTFDELRKQVWALPPKGHPSGTAPYRRYEEGLLRPDKKPGFRTPTGKIEVYSTTLESYGLDPLPYFEEPVESPLRTPELWKEFPLIMMTGRRSPVLFHSEHRQIPWLREIDPDPIVEIHPETARALDIEDGNWVWIEGRRGRAKRKAKLTPIVHRQMVMVPHGWWLPEKEGKDHLYGVWDININQLIPMGYQSRSGFGGGPYKSMLCKIYKV